MVSVRKPAQCPFCGSTHISGELKTHAWLQLKKDGTPSKHDPVEMSEYQCGDGRMVDGAEGCGRSFWV